MVAKERRGQEGNDTVRKPQEPVWLWSEHTGVGLPQWPACSPRPSCFKRVERREEKRETMGKGSWKGEQKENTG